MKDTNYKKTYKLNWYIFTLTEIFVNEKEINVYEYNKEGTMWKFWVRAIRGRKKGGIEGMERKWKEIELNTRAVSRGQNELMNRL
jgi:hypothetical protein